MTACEIAEKYEMRLYRIIWSPDSTLRQQKEAKRKLVTLGDVIGDLKRLYKKK